MFIALMNHDAIVVVAVIVLIVVVVVVVVCGCFCAPAAGITCARLFLSVSLLQGNSRVSAQRTAETTSTETTWQMIMTTTGKINNATCGHASLWLLSCRISLAGAAAADETDTRAMLSLLARRDPQKLGSLSLSLSAAAAAR